MHLLHPAASREDQLSDKTLPTYTINNVDTAWLKTLQRFASKDPYIQPMFKGINLCTDGDKRIAWSSNLYRIIKCESHLPYIAAPRFFARLTEVPDGTYQMALVSGSCCQLIQIQEGNSAEECKTGMFKHFDHEKVAKNKIGEFSCLHRDGLLLRLVQPLNVNIAFLADMPKANWHIYNTTPFTKSPISSCVFVPHAAEPFGGRVDTLVAVMPLQPL